MKRYRSALALLGVLLALGGLATWDEWQTKKDEDEKKTKNRLTDAKLEDVVEVALLSQGGVEDADDGSGEKSASSKVVEPVDAVLSKKDGVWRLLKPVDALADSAAVEGLAKTIIEYAYTQKVADNREKWGEFGLANPKRTVTLRFSESTKRQPLIVHVGAKAPVGYSAYLRVEGDDKVYMGSQYLLTGTSKSLFEMRDKVIVKIDESKVQSFVYERQGEPKIELTKSGDKYEIKSPESIAADTAEAREFLSELGLAKASGFVDVPSDELNQALSKPLYRITWSDDKGASSSLVFADWKGKFYTAFAPGQRAFELSEDFRTKVKKELMDFRDRKILGVDTADVKDVRIDGANFTNIGGEWYALEDAGKFGPDGKFAGDAKDKPTEKSHVRAFLVDLEFAKTDKFYLPSAADVAPSLQKAPVHSVELGLKNPEGQRLKIEVYAIEGVDDKFLVTKSGADTVYRLAKTVFASMQPEKASDTPGGQIPQLDEEAPMPEGEEGAGGTTEAKDTALGSAASGH